MTAPVLDLPRLILRRAAWVAVVALAAAAAFGWHSAAQDVEDEVLGAQALVDVLQQLHSTPAPDVAAWARLQRGPGLRHLQLSVTNAQGRPVFTAAAAPPAEVPMRWVLAWHRQWQALPEARTLSWTVPRPEGAWTVTAHVSPEAERREALADLGRLLAVLALGLLVLWLGLRLGLRRAFAPMSQLLHAIGAMATHGARALQALPPMPIRELAAVQEALRRLADELDRAQGERRLLSQKVQSVQEEERTRLARELHDEMGQCLTALRVDIAWLRRQVQDQPSLAAVVASMGQRCDEAQQELRGVLHSLRPLGGVGAADEPVPLERLLQLLTDLVASWCAGSAAQDRQGLQPSFETAQSEGDGDKDGTPLSQALIQRLQLPASLALALYRLSQEGLTNVARHAQARRATLRLTVRLHGDSVCGVDWSLTDDGVGLPAGADVLHRGNGLGGMQERVWALGGEWRVAPAAAGRRPGVRLVARLPWPGVAT